MTLLQYIELFSASALARALVVTPSFVIQMAGGTKPVPPKRAVQIERATRGKVTRQELRSDWREVWPELEAIERAARFVRGMRRTPQHRAAAAGKASRAIAYPRVPRHKNKSSMDDLLLSSMMHGFLAPLCRTRPTVTENTLIGWRREKPL